MKSPMGPSSNWPQLRTPAPPSLSAIGAQQAATTESMTDAIDQLLYYCATYPNYVIVFRYSDIILATNSDAGFYN